MVESHTIDLKELCASKVIPENSKRDKAMYGVI